MRTKTLILTAVLGAASVASSFAQVFSQNAVGYVTQSIPVGFTMFANPLNNTAANGNTISNLFAGGVPNGTTIYKFNNASGAYTINTFSFAGWSTPNDTLVPGEGAFIRNTSAGPISVTFVGDVMQGSLSNPIPAGFSIKSSQVPQQGGISSVLGYPTANGDVVYLFNNASGAYQTFTFAFGNWGPSEPVINVGQSFFARKATAASWNRTFSVNN
jgi:hypothetical protein